MSIYDNPKLVAIRIFVTEEIRRAFKAYVARKGTSMNEEISSYIEAIVKEEEK